MNIKPLQYKSELVATTLIVSEFLGAEERRITENYNRNQDKFVEGKHFFKLSHDNAKSVVHDYQGTKGLIIWTERGCARHSKLLTTSEAWDLWEDMEDTYFKSKLKVEPALPAYTTTQRIADIETSITILEKLGMLDDRDKLYYADSVRNAGQLMLPQAEDIQPVTISSRVIELGYKALSGQLSKIGKLVAKLYRDELGESPVKHTQYVDGAPRNVNSYTSEHLELIDLAINEVLG